MTRPAFAYLGDAWQSARADFRAEVAACARYCEEQSPCRDHRDSQAEVGRLWEIAWEAHEAAHWTELLNYCDCGACADNGRLGSAVRAAAVARVWEASRLVTCDGPPLRDVWRSLAPAWVYPCDRGPEWEASAGAE